jgi:hypothetical protein
MASYKINDVEGLIADQEWKMKHSINTPRLSVLATVGSIALGLLISVLCFCFCCKCCKRRWPRFLKWFTDNDNCASIVFKPKIVNSVHASTNGLRGRGLNLRLVSGLKDESEIEGDVTELTPMNVSVTPTMPRSSSKKLVVGKR